MTIPQTFQKALQYLEAGRLAEAEVLYRQILGVDPSQADAFHMLGVIAAQIGRNTLAADLIGRALALKPHYPEAYYNLGHVLKEKGQLDDAIAAYRRAIALKFDYPEAHNNLGFAAYDKGQLDEAIAAYRQAVALKPDFPEAHNNLGGTLHDKDRLDEAIAAYRQAIALKPNFPEALSNLAVAKYDVGQLDEAIAAHRQAIALKPDLAEAHVAFALTLLAQGDFLEGWEEYEWRWQGKDGGQRGFAQPQWDGGSLEGRTMLLHAEQGFGDTLQFIRYAPLVAQRGGRVIVECQPGLAALLASVAGISQIVTRGEPLPAFDVHCPLMSLPRAFGMRLETIPADIPYLRADAQKTAHWWERLAREAGSEAGSGRSEPLKVGLVWAGGTRPQQPHANRIDRRRSMSLSQFAPLAGVPGVVFVSLQKGGPSEQALTPPAGLRLLDWTAELGDFADTAALVEALDLVISVDTAVVHLAGALGKPVWVLNRFDSCWRWLRDRTDSPWYPTMRLFRQTRPGEWGSVMEQVAGILREVRTSTNNGE